MLDRPRVRDGAEHVPGPHRRTLAGGGDEPPATDPAGPPRARSQPGGRARQRPQEPVEDVAEQTGAQSGRQRLPASRRRVAGSQAARVLVGLHGHPLTADRHHLPRQGRRTQVHDLAHRGAVESGDVDQRPVDPEDGPGCPRCVGPGGHGAHSASTCGPSPSTIRSASTPRLRSTRRPGISATTPPSGCSRTTAVGTELRACDRREPFEQVRISGLGAQPPRRGPAAPPQLVVGRALRLQHDGAGPPPGARPLGRAHRGRVALALGPGLRDDRGGLAPAPRRRRPPRRRPRTRAGRRRPRGRGRAARRGPVPARRPPPPTASSFRYHHGQPVRRSVGQRRTERPCGRGGEDHERDIRGQVTPCEPRRRRDPPPPRPGHRPARTPGSAAARRAPPPDPRLRPFCPLMPGPSA